MAKFVFIIKDKDPDILDKDLYYRHIDYLKRCAGEGKLHLVGPLKGHDKLLQVIEASSAEEAEILVKQDPYIEKGHYRNFEIYELLESNADNNWLMDTPRIKDMLKNLK